MNLPFVHVAVHKWGGNHPTVIGRGGGGISADMRHALIVGFLTMTLLAAVVLWMRARLALAASRCRHLEELAANAGIED